MMASPGRTALEPYSVVGVCPRMAVSSLRPCADRRALCYREVDYEKASVVGGGPAGVQHDGLGVQLQRWLLEHVDERIHAVALGSAHDAVAEPDPGSVDVDESVGQLQSVWVFKWVWML